MVLKRGKAACVVPVFKKPSRRVAGALRHVVFTKGMNGGKNLVLRAGRYSVHQFAKSFSALFAAIVVIPSLLKKGFLHLAPKKREDGTSWGAAISASIKSTVMGIPSLLRSAWASVKAWFYAVGASIYHAIESAKAFVMGFKVAQAVGHMNRSIGSFFLGLYQSVKIPVVHFGEYVGTVWESFRTGTVEKLGKLKTKEKEWGHDLAQHLDEGRNYVSGAVHSAMTAVGTFFERIWEIISSSFETVHSSVVHAGTKVRETSHVVLVKIQDSAGTVGHFFKSAPRAISSFFAKAPGVVKEKAQYIVVNIHDSATNVGTKVKIAMADLLQMIKGVGNKLHEEEVHVKTVAHDIHVKAHDIVDGFKVGTVEIFRKVGAKGKAVKEQADLYFKAAHGKISAGRLLIKRRVAMKIGQAQAGAHHLRERIAETERSTRGFLVENAKKVHAVVAQITRPLVTPFIYVYELPHRLYESIPSPTVSSYMAMLMTAVLSYWLYLKIDCRYKRETYARKLAPHPKVCPFLVG